MSQAAKILKINSLGIPLEQIANQLGFEMAQLREIIRQELPLKQQSKAGKSWGMPKRSDRLPIKREYRCSL